MTPEVISKLEEGFLRYSLTDREACLYAGISPQTLYEYCKNNPEFSERKELLKEQVKIKAKQNLTQEIGEGDKSLSQWWLERRAKDEFAQKTEVQAAGSFTIEVVDYKKNAPEQPLDSNK